MHFTFTEQKQPNYSSTTTQIANLFSLEDVALLEK